MIDLQNGVCQEQERQLYQLPQLISRVNQRINAYRQATKPVVFVQHSDEELVYKSKAWQLYSELDFQMEDYYVEKRHANAFYHTNLFAVLKKLNVAKIEFCGAQTEYCIDGTLQFAHGLGFENYLMPNHHSTYDNQWLTAQQTITFFESLWQGRYVELIAETE